MDAKNILDGLLEQSQRATRVGMQIAEERAVIPPSGDERTAMLKGAGAGALGAGAIALLFGSKGTRKFAKKAARLGGTAALGGLAYKVYTEWQAQQQQPASAPPRLDAATSSGSSLNLKQFEVGTPIDALVDEPASRRSEALMRAMITAARVDGHVDEQERDLIARQIDNLGLEQDVTRFLLAEMTEAVDVNRIAALADTRETAAELYIASAMVADADDPRGRTYLDELAGALQLEPALVAELEAPLRD